MTSDPSRPAARVPRVAAAGVVLKGDQVLLVRRRTPPHEGRWTFPGGKVRFGESLRDACRREVEEETGLTVEPGEVVEVYEARVGGEGEELRFHYVIVDILCLPLGDEEPTGLSDALDARWFPVDALPAAELTEGVPVVLRKALSLRERDSR